MKSNLRKVISMMLCLAMVFAMMPNFSGFNANAENLIGSQGEGVTIEDNFPGKNDKPEVLTAEPEDEAQLEVSGAEETEETGTWAEYILQSPQTMKYKYVDFSPFLDNDGNWKGPKNATISTAEQLAGLMVIVNADANTTIKDNKDRQITIKSTRISFSGCTIKLIEKIDLSAHEWVPIGKDENHSFSASLDGSATEDGICEIQGMKIGIKSYWKNQYTTGLIGYVKGENITISNVGIDKNSEIYAILSSDVGGLVGRAENCIFENCYNTGTIDGRYCVGELVGRAENCIFENCYNTGTVSCGGDYVGGLVGCAENCIFENCYNTGTISGICEVGGLVGYTKAEVRLENCYNTGNISIIIIFGSQTNGYTGGIIGCAESNATLNNCYNTGFIGGYADNGKTFAGGIVGHAESSATLNDCYNTGFIEGRTENEKIFEKIFVGGLVGYANEVRLENCYNTGTINFYNNRTISCEGDYAGGLVGYVWNTAEVKLENCYNTGTISGGQGCCGVGGLVGYAWLNAEVRLENCYNTGTINGGQGCRGVGGLVGDAHPHAKVKLKNCYNTGTISGEDMVGGLVGVVLADIEVRLENCYNTGTISGIYKVGGLVGVASNCILENCYYLGATQGVGNKADEESGAINLLKDTQTESVELRPNEIKTIPNTEANFELRANSELQKLGKDFKMVYIYETPKDITISSEANEDNKLSISMIEGAKSGVAKLKGIKITQNALTKNGYTGNVFEFEKNLTCEKSFDINVLALN